MPSIGSHLANATCGEDDVCMNPDCTMCQAGHWTSPRRHNGRSGRRREYLHVIDFRCEACKQDFCEHEGIVTDQDYGPYGTCRGCSRRWSRLRSFREQSHCRHPQSAAGLYRQDGTEELIVVDLLPIEPAQPTGAPQLSAPREIFREGITYRNEFVLGPSPDATLWSTGPGGVRTQEDFPIYVELTTDPPEWGWNRVVPRKPTK
jgi:hypothetical protein